MANAGYAIQSVEAYVAEIPFRRPFVVWRGTVPSKQHVLVKMTTENGTTGWGEAAPFLYYAPETASDVLSMVRDVMAPELVGRDSRAIRAVMAEFDAIDGHEFAKAAVETALWDVLGRLFNAPLSQLLGGRVRDTVPVLAVLHSDEPDAMAAETRNLVADGYSRLKLKIGFGADQDDAMVRAVREAGGPDVLIRVDAEESYRPKEALVIARQLERHDLELISQPVHRSNWEGMAFLRSSLETPVLADEGIHSSADVLTCIRSSAADMVNIKVLKSGGIISSINMAALCDAAHMPIVIGSMIESGIGSLACAQLASVLPGVFSTELCGPALLESTLLTRELRIVDGSLRLDDSPGLGAAVSEDELAQYRVA